MNFEGVLVFVQVAKAGSLSEAARRLKLKPMAATRRLASLEEELGVRLVQRTTRSVSLTAEGMQFLPFASTMIEAAEAGQASITSQRDGATGLLRVTSCGSLGRTVIMSLLPSLMKQHSGLRVDLQLTDTLIDLVSSGVDVAIRIGELRDSSLVATRLGDNQRLLCASPRYLEAFGKPETVSDLADHECILSSGSYQWTFVTERNETTVNVAGRLTVSNMDGVLDACLAGNGLAVLSSWHAKESITAGRLEVIHLHESEPKSVPIWALYPTRRQLLPKVEVFINAMKAALD